MGGVSSRETNREIAGVYVRYSVDVTRIQKSHPDGPSTTVGKTIVTGRGLNLSACGARA